VDVSVFGKNCTGCCVDDTRHRTSNSYCTWWTGQSKLSQSQCRKKNETQAAQRDRICRAQLTAWTSSWFIQC